MHLGDTHAQYSKEKSATDTDALAVSSTRLDLIIPVWGQSIHYRSCCFSGELPEVFIFRKNFEEEVKMRLCLMFICLMLASAAGAKPDEVTMSLMIS